MVPNYGHDIPGIQFYNKWTCFYALPLLELYPDYICPGDVPNCGPSDHCKDPNRFPVNWNSSRSLHNWVEIYRLDCVEPYRIGLLGSM